jgi:hypothetical protein
METTQEISKTLERIAKALEIIAYHIANKPDADTEEVKLVDDDLQNSLKRIADRFADYGCSDEEFPQFKD